MLDEVAQAPGQPVPEFLRIKGHLQAQLDGIDRGIVAFAVALIALGGLTAVREVHDGPDAGHSQRPVRECTAPDLRVDRRRCPVERALPDAGRGDHPEIGKRRVAEVRIVGARIRIDQPDGIVPAGGFALFHERDVEGDGALYARLVVPGHRAVGGNRSVGDGFRGEFVHVDGKLDSVLLDPQQHIAGRSLAEIVAHGHIHRLVEKGDPHGVAGFDPRGLKVLQQEPSVRLQIDIAVFRYIVEGRIGSQFPNALPQRAYMPCGQSAKHKNRQPCGGKPLQARHHGLPPNRCNLDIPSIARLTIAQCQQ